MFRKLSSGMEWEGDKGPPINLAWGPRRLNPALRRLTRTDRQRKGKETDRQIQTYRGRSRYTDIQIQKHIHRQIETGRRTHKQRETKRRTDTDKQEHRDRETRTAGDKGRQSQTGTQAESHAHADTVKQRQTDKQIQK